METKSVYQSFLWALGEALNPKPTKWTESQPNTCRYSTQALKNKDIVGNWRHRLS